MRQSSRLAFRPYQNGSVGDPKYAPRSVALVLDAREGDTHRAVIGDVDHRVDRACGRGLRRRERVLRSRYVGAADAMQDTVGHARMVAAASARRPSSSGRGSTAVFLFGALGARLVVVSDTIQNCEAQLTARMG